MTPNTHQPFRLALDQILLDALNRDPKSPIAMTGEGVVFSIQDFFQHANLLKERLMQGPSHTQKWAVYSDSCISGLIAIFAVLWSGREPVLLPNTCDETLEEIAGLVDGFITDVFDLNTIKPVIYCDQLMSGDEIEFSADTFIISSTATIYLYTSGSTGRPEMISKSFASLEIEVYALTETFSDLLQNAPVLSTVSHQHIYGLLTRILWPLATCRLILDGLLHFPHEVSAQLQKFPTACLISSPAFLKRAGHLVDYPKGRHTKTIIFSSGGPLSASTSIKIRSSGAISVIEIFGSTETGGIAYREQKSIEIEESWTSLPRVQVRAAGDILEICSPHIDVDGWWKTQDRVSITDDGFTLLGRADRLAKVEEKRVHLDDIENHLISSPLIVDAYIFILGNEKPQICAVIVPSDDGWDIVSQQGRREFCKTLRGYMAKRFEKVTFPRKWKFVQQIPVNTQGKRQLSTIKSMFSDEPSPPPLPQITKSIISESGENISLSFFVPNTLSLLEGHFPQQPIVAGVVQIYWADSYAREYYDISDTAYKLNQIKFNKLIKPAAHYQLNLSRAKAGKSIKFEIYDLEDICASGQLSYDLERE
jgi:acyl-coenzyme A synthetase/AMP-(fatty) acid ligase